MNLKPRFKHDLDQWPNDIFLEYMDDSYDVKGGTPTQFDLWYCEDWDGEGPQLVLRFGVIEKEFLCVNVQRIKDKNCAAYFNIPQKRFEELFDRALKIYEEHTADPSVSPAAKAL